MSDATTRVLSWAMSWPLVAAVLKLDGGFEVRGPWAVAVTDPERDGVDIGRQIALSETIPSVYWLMLLIASGILQMPAAVSAGVASAAALSALAADRTAVVGDE